MSEMLECIEDFSKIAYAYIFKQIVALWVKDLVLLLKGLRVSSLAWKLLHASGRAKKFWKKDIIATKLLQTSAKNKHGHFSKWLT